MNTDKTKFDIKSATQHKSCSNIPMSGCKSCERLPGIPIFPVRYSVCSILDNDPIPKLPDEIINAFTSITLNQYIDDKGALQQGTPFNRYILRKVRKGYLYIYDEIYGGQWQCFGVHPDGELTAFAPEKPIPLVSLNKFSCRTPENYYISSAITIPPGKSRNIYVSYVEYPLSIEHMDQLKNNVTMRQSCMQKFSIANNNNDTIASNKGLLRPYSDIAKYLPEYHSKYSRYAIGNSEVNSDISQGTLIQTGSNLETQHAIESALSSVANDSQSHPGLMMIVHDEIGLIEQLKILRQEPYNEAKKKAIERPEGLGLREMYWLQSVQTLEEGISQQLDEAMDKIKNQDSPAAHEQYIKEASKLLAEFIDNSHNPSPFEADNYTRPSAIVKGHEQEIIDTSLMKDRILSEFKRYYDVDKRKSLEDYFSPYFEHIKKSKLILDANYCDWTKDKLEIALKRYDTTNIENSTYAVHILGSILDDGSIFSINSSRLWQWLHEESTKDSSSIIARGICLNNDSIRSNYDITQLESAPSEFEANEAPSSYFDTLKLKNWYDIIKKGQKLQEKRNDIMTKEITTPLNAWRAGWKDFWKPYKQLQQAIASSRIALYQQHAAQLIAEQAITWHKAIDLSPTLKQLQITGAVEAAVEGESLESRAFKLSKVKVSYEKSIETIKTNNSYFTEKANTSNKYTPNAFKTGSKKISNIASGNFSYNTEDIRNAAIKNKQPSQPHNHYFYTSENKQQNRVATNNTSSERTKKYNYDKRINFVELEPPRKINYIAITDLSNNVLEGMLSEEEKVLIAEQEKVAEAWTGGKSAIIFANLIMSFKNMKEAIDSLGKKDAGLVEFWKAMGTSIASIQAAGDVISNMVSYRSANKLNIIEKLDLAKTANTLKFETNLLSKTVAVIGIIDSVITFAKAYKKYKHGGTARDMYIEMAIGSLSLVGSIATLCAGSAVLAPVILTLLIIIVGISFLLTHLVPKNIENWLRRSLYGRDQKTVKGGIFKDIIEEQDALQMVLKGVTVDIELNKVTLRSGTEENYTELKTYDLKAKIQYPKTINENIYLKIARNKGAAIATIKRLQDGKIENRFLSGINMTGNLSEKEVSIIEDHETSDFFSTLDITYILGIDREKEPSIDIQFEVQLDNAHKREVFYVSV